MAVIGWAFELFGCGLLEVEGALAFPMESERHRVEDRGSLFESILIYGEGRITPSFFLMFRTGGGGFLLN